MAKKTTEPASRTYGMRYGKKIREQTAALEREARRKHSCPYCHYTAVKRKASGIWHCTKCENTFTGRAYTATPKIANPYALQREEIETVEE